MLMHDVPPEEWDSFLNTFNRQHHREPVTLEKSDVQDGLRVIAYSAPLVRIVHDRAKQLLSITVGDSPPQRVTHTVTHADGIAVEEPEHDEDFPLTIHLMGGGQHLVARVNRVENGGLGAHGGDS
jgi:hypothetical protein